MKAPFPFFSLGRCWRKVSQCWTAGADIAGGEKCINLIYNIKKIKKIKKTFDIVKGVCYYIEVDGRKEKNDGRIKE